MALAAAASSSFSASPSTFRFSSDKVSPFLKFQFPLSALYISLNSSLVPLPPCLTSPNFSNAGPRFFQLKVAQQVFQVEEEETQKKEEENRGEKRRKLCVLNLPWNYSAPDISNLFSQCGNVKHVEIIKQKDGRNRGFAFVTMASGEEAEAVKDKFDSYEIDGRIIRVEFAKRKKKPPPPPPEGAVIGETRHKIYVSNVAWKVRSSHLREFFASNCKPVSARVVFENPSGRSAGYGFVSFTTEEEAEAAVSALDGKELMGRPLRLKISQKKIDESGDEMNVDVSTEAQSEES